MKSAWTAMIFLVTLIGCSDSHFSVHEEMIQPPSLEEHQETLTERPVDPTNPILLSYKGIINGGLADQQIAFETDPESLAFVFRIPMIIPNVNWPNSQHSIRGLPHARINLKSSQKWPEIELIIPFKYLESTNTFMPAARLPNGDPLPGMAKSEMPHLKFEIPDSNGCSLHLYLDKGIAGAYISTPVDPYFAMTFHIRDQQQTAILGHFSLIPETSRAFGGVFQSMVLTQDVANEIAGH